ncbi:MAG: RsmD family RNA methyltransferase [Deltaproteobacteria bacterium]|nr:RsmD family RNA methyltransferase [Deltaproteobacteria bacterium]
MRIIAGSCRGMTLRTPRGDMTRPSSSKLREAVMMLLMPWLEDSVFIDLFAGSGSVGLEAVSRCAREAIFVEKSKDALSCLKANLQACQMRCDADRQRPKVRMRLVSRDVSHSLQGQLCPDGTADIIWADPPYQDAVAWLKSPDTVRVLDLLKSGGCFAMEYRSCDRDQILLPCGGDENWERLKDKQYGDTAVTIWSKN